MKRKWQLSVLETALFAMFGGMMFASKVLMARIPNVHLIALFIMVLTTVYRFKALFPIAIYILLEGLVYGFSVWWIPYLYLWPLLWGVVMLLPKNLSDRWRLILYPVFGLLHGLSFGTLFAPVHALAFRLSFQGMIAWIAAGFPWDVVHGVSNFVIAFLSVPLIRLIRKLDHKMRSSDNV